jgi:hypothetical protein
MFILFSLGTTASRRHSGRRSTSKRRVFQSSLPMGASMDQHAGSEQVIGDCIQETEGSRQVTKNIPLAACPFCGMSAGFRRCQNSNDPNFNGEWIECSGCHSSTPIMFPLMDCVREQLAEMWNRRVVPAHPAQSALLYQRAFLECHNALRSIMVICEDEETPLSMGERLEEIGDVALVNLLAWVSMKPQGNIAND